MSKGRPKALVYGRAGDLLVPVPALLTRAGFDVTLVTTVQRFKALKHVARCVIVRLSDLVPTVVAELEQGYELVVAGDDVALRMVRDADLPLDVRLRLLPIASERGLEHLASKIGLSRVFAAAGVNTPEFSVVAERHDLAGAIAPLGYPVMLKTDFGMASKAVVRLDSEADLKALRADFEFPALVQRAIDGRVHDCSGFFRAGKPIAVTFSSFTGMGLSVVRTYVTRPEQDASFMAELGAIGQALDANGFVSLSAIRSEADGRLYFFEADMRPTVWVEYPKHFGADPALRIAAAFGLPLPASRQPSIVPQTMELAFGPRLSWFDVVLNRYNCRGTYDDYLGQGLLLLTFQTSPLGRSIKASRKWVKKTATKLFKRVRRRVARAARETLDLLSRRGDA